MNYLVIPFDGSKLVIDTQENMVLLTTFLKLIKYLLERKTVGNLMDLNGCWITYLKQNNG
jgi:hypothetical protein